MADHPLRRLWSWFTAVDADHSGFITAPEIREYYGGFAANSRPLILARDFSQRGRSSMEIGPVRTSPGRSHRMCADRD